MDFQRPASWSGQIRYKSSAPRQQQLAEVDAFVHSVFFIQFLIVASTKISKYSGRLRNDVLYRMLTSIGFVVCLLTCAAILPGSGMHSFQFSIALYILQIEA